MLPRQSSTTLFPYTTLFRSHLHLADGSGKTTKDEHLPPGEGNQPCAEVLRRLANRGWQGSVLLEINTRGLGDRKSTRLNSSHVAISYAVFCLKTKRLRTSL